MLSAATTSACFPGCSRMSGSPGASAAQRSRSRRRRRGTCRSRDHLEGLDDAMGERGTAERVQARADDRADLERVELERVNGVDRVTQQVLLLLLGGPATSSPGTSPRSRCGA